MKTKEKEEIIGALARGYCSKENENKTVDPELLQSINKELLPIFQSLHNDLNFWKRKAISYMSYFCPEEIPMLKKKRKF